MSARLLLHKNIWIFTQIIETYNFPLGTTKRYNKIKGI